VRRFSIWLPTLSMMLVSLISYIDRNTLALLAPTILRETKLSNEQYGWIISTFSIAYMAGNPVWGRALDRVGVRFGMVAAVGLWTVASTAHALAGGFRSFAVARAVLGFGEGATFPGGLRTAVQTLPPSKRSRGVAICYSGGALGALVTPIVVTPIALWWGWRAAFWFTGLIGAAWIAHWLVMGRRDDIRRIPAAADPEASPLDWRDRRLFAALAAYALGALPLGFVLYQSSLYLNQAMGVSQATIGKLLWIPPLGWEIGYFFWGWRADRAIASPSRLAGYRRLLSVSLLLGLPLALVPWIGSLAMVMAILFLAMFTTAGFIIVPISYATWVFSARSSGLIAGLCAGSWSAAVALAMPLAGRLFDLRRYDLAFLLAASFPVAGFTIWRLLAFRTPIAPRTNGG
jgi:ACS family hexuronate transporter-like MFS transporter